MSSLSLPHSGVTVAFPSDDGAVDLHVLRHKGDEIHPQTGDPGLEFVL